eukprot:7273674-Prymnesium_polylepis.1
MAMRSARKAAARPPREQSDRHGDHWSPCRYRARWSALHSSSVCSGRRGASFYAQVGRPRSRPVLRSRALSGLA